MGKSNIAVIMPKITVTIQNATQTTKKAMLRAIDCAA